MHGNFFIVILVYVDDVVITGNDFSFINHVKQHLDVTFSIKDLGCLTYFQEIEVAQSKEGIVLNQQKYILDLLDEVSLLGAKPVSFPWIPNIV